MVESGGRLAWFGGVFGFTRLPESRDYLRHRMD